MSSHKTHEKVQQGFWHKPIFHFHQCKERIKCLYWLSAHYYLNRRPRETSTKALHLLRWWLMLYSMIANGSFCSGPRKIHHVPMTHLLCSLWSFSSGEATHLISQTHRCQILCSAAPVPHLWCLVSFFWSLLTMEDGRFWFSYHYPTQRQELGRQHAWEMLVLP